MEVNIVGFLAISIPKKYFKEPKSFIWKHELKYALNLVIDEREEPVIKRSSTYIKTQRKTSPT